MTRLSSIHIIQLPLLFIITPYIGILRLLIQIITEWEYTELEIMIKICPTNGFENQLRVNINSYHSWNMSRKNNRFENFELCIFKGCYKRVDAVTNIHHGVVHSLWLRHMKMTNLQQKLLNRPRIHLLLNCRPFFGL